MKQLLIILTFLFLPLYLTSQTIDTLSATEVNVVGGKGLVLYKLNEVADYTNSLIDAANDTVDGSTVFVELVDTTDLVATKTDIKSYLLEFIVGTTVNAPSDGDSTLTHGSLLNKHIEWWKNGIKQWYSSLTDSTLTVRPYYATGDTVIIEATDASSWTALSLRDTTATPTGTNMITNGTFDDATSWDDSHGDWTISGGVATYGGALTDGAYVLQLDADMVSSIQPNTAYTFTYTADAQNRIRLYNSAGDVMLFDATVQASGTHSVSFTTPADVSGGGISIRAWDYGFSIDNISLTED